MTGKRFPMKLENRRKWRRRYYVAAATDGWVEIALHPEWRLYRREIEADHMWRNFWMIRRQARVARVSLHFGWSLAQRRFSKNGNDDYLRERYPEVWEWAYAEMMKALQQPDEIAVHADQAASLQA